MRVLILRHGYYPRDPRVRREARALTAAGHQVDVLCLRATGEARRETVDGVGVWRLPLGHRRAGRARYVAEYGAFFLAAAACSTAGRLRRRHRIVQVNTMPDALLFAAAPARLLGARLVLDLHEVMPELYCSKFGVAEDHPLPRLLARMEQAAIRFADAAIAVSEPCRARYVERGAPPERLTVVMNSADPELFRPRAAPPPPSVRPLVVGHGTLAHRYGFDLLLEALALVPEARLEILGEGEARPALERRVRELGLGNRVTLAGFVPLDQIARRLARAHVGVVPNRPDPFTELVVPTKLLEYVALELPAVVAHTRAAAAYFDASMLTWFRPGEPEDLARALRQVLADPAAAAARAERARRRFERRHAWPVMARRYVELLERLAGT